MKPYCILTVLFLLILCASANVSAENPAWKFRSDLSNSGVYDDGGITPEGTLLWSYPTGDEVESSPAVADGVVYIGGHALDAQTGDLIWWFRPRDIIESSPAVADGVVYVGCEDGSLYALDADTGGVLWNYTTGAGVHSSPAVADGVVYFGSKDHHVYALDSETGTAIWNFTTGSPIFSSPAVVDGVVYVGSCDKNVYALDAMTGDLVWNYTTGGMVYSSPAVLDGLVHIGSFDGLFYVLHADTGEFFWSYAAGEPVYSSPAVADGIIYFGCRNGYLYALNTEIPGYRWSYHAGQGIDSSPAVADGVVYFTSTDYPGNCGLFALDALTGEFLWKYTTQYGLRSSPAVADGTVYFGSDDRGSVFAIGPDTGSPNLMIGKSAPAFHDNACEMEYTLFYKNQGSGTAADATLTEYLPPSVEFVSGTHYPIYNETERTVTWWLGSLISQASGSRSLTVRIPSSVSYGTILTNTANITTTTPESRYDDNCATANTTVKELWFPPGISVAPSLPGPWGEATVNWRDTVTFSYNQTICPPETPVSIRIHIDDGGPDISAPMTGGPQHWDYTTTFYPRYGAARVSYETPGCIISGITFDVRIEPAGYVYDSVSGNRISGANVWLQWSDENGDWVNVPPGLVDPPMEPDENPRSANAAGQYQWDVSGGSYRVFAEADGYAPAASTMVNSPPQLSGLSLGLMPTTGKLRVTSTPTGAAIYLDGSDTGSVTFHELAGIPAGQHEVVLKLAGYPDYHENVTVTAGATTFVGWSFDSLPPVANFTGSVTSGDAPLDVTFSDTSTGAVTTRFWDFGDGTMTWANETPSISHTYLFPGTFSVSLTVGNSYGQDTETKTGYIMVSPSGRPPAVRFSAMPALGNPPMTVRFTDRSTGAPVAWNWDFGDGNSSSEQNPSFTYTTAGRYRVTLTACNSGGSGSFSSYVWVRGGISPTPTITTKPTIPPSERAPIAFFMMNKSFGYAPMGVQFVDRSFHGPTSWSWDFGDGETSILENPVHTFEEPGTYTVSLTASNSLGGSSTSRRLYVR